MSSDPFQFSRASKPNAGGNLGPQQMPQWHSFNNQNQNPTNPYPLHGSMGTMSSAPAPQMPVSMFNPTPMQTSEPTASQMNFGNSGSDMINNLSSNPFAQMGVAYGRDLLQSNFARYAPGASAMWLALRFYFDLDTDYIRKKFVRYFFPFAMKKWNRNLTSQAQRGAQYSQETGHKFCSPSSDDCSPDLYIPTMAFLTYVLICGLLLGTRMQFSPEVLVQVSSNGLLFLLLEVFIIRASTYALSIEDASVFDLIAYCTYKYIALTTNTLLGILFGSTAYHLSLLYTAICTAYFFIKTFQPIVDPSLYDPTAPTLSSISKFQRTYFVFACGVLQSILIWWLGYY